MTSHNHMNNTIYDLVGIGLGPFNLGMAALTNDLTDITACFFEKKPNFDWHTGIMPEWSTLQIPFIADLVSFADPTSRFSYLNYLKKTGGLYQFYIREDFCPLRSEYNQYCSWVSNQLENLNYSCHVTDITYDEQQKLYTVFGQNGSDSNFAVQTKNIALGTGRAPIVPDFCKIDQEDINLGAHYSINKPKYQQKKSITIVGSGQSSAEIFYDLLQDIDVYGYELNWVTMANRIFAMDLGKLSLEMTSPDYTDYFFSLSESTRNQVISRQDHLYKGINLKLINDIYDLLYIKAKKSPINVNMLINVRLNDVEKKNDQTLSLQLNHLDLNKEFKMDTQALILALGYEYKTPEFIHSISEKINRDDTEGRYQIARNYSIDDDETIFVQNVGLYSHGISVPDLGMGCYRNSIIINQILGEEYYQVEKKIAFQDFLPKALQ